MSKTVAGRGVLVGGSGWHETAGGLYCARGRRKYLTRWERLRAIEAASKAHPDHALYALVLAWSGARVSEVLAITPVDCQLDSSVSSTAIYADAVGPDECIMAGRLWAPGVGGGGETPQSPA